MIQKSRGGYVPHEVSNRQAVQLIVFPQIISNSKLGCHTDQWMKTVRRQEQHPPVNMDFYTKEHAVFIHFGTASPPGEVGIQHRTKKPLATLRLTIHNPNPLTPLSLTSLLYPLRSGFRNFRARVCLKFWFFDWTKPEA